MNEFSVLSLNTWMQRGPWQKRWEAAFSGIAKLAPDILAFQEVFDAAWAEEIRRRTGKKNLTVFSEHSSGLIILADYSFEKAEIIRYAAKSPNENYFRYAVFTAMRMPWGPLHFFNTHLSWQPPDKEVRKEQIGELTAWIDGQGARPAIVTGDFNADAGTEEIERMAAAGFTDSFKAVHPDADGHTWSHGNPYTHAEGNKLHDVVLPERRIDFIFARPASRLRVKSSEVVLTEGTEEGVWASDHFGVFSVFSVI